MELDRASGAMALAARPSDTDADRTVLKFPSFRGERTVTWGEASSEN